MRLVLVIDSLGGGGAQRQLVAVFNELRRRGLDAWILYYYPHHHFIGSVDPVDLERVICLDQPTAAGPKTVFPALRARLAALRPDAVLSFLRGASTMVGWARLSGLRFRWVASERASFLDSSEAVRIAAYLASVRTADVVAPNSHHMAARLRRRGLPAHRVVVVPNGIVVDPRAEGAGDRPDGAPRLLMVGNRRPEKNHVAAVEALATLRDRPWTLDHLGRTGEDSDLDRRVERAVADGQIEDRMTFRGPVTDVGPWYGRASALLHPSTFEGFPNVVLEAWSWGCPVVVSDRCDLPRIVEHGVTGLVAPLGRSDGLRRALARVLDDPGGLRQMGEAGRSVVRERYALPRVVDQWLALLRGGPDTPVQRLIGYGRRLVGA